MSNPFADPPRLDENPFADPSVVNAQRSGQYHSNESFEDALDEPVKPSAAYRQDETAARLEEIRKREAALAERERDVGQREAHIKRYGKNQWPPFYPLIFHDIEAEIPAESKPVVLTLYRLWLLLIATLIANLVAGILMLVSGRPDGGKDMGAAIMYLPVITVLSFLLWYRPIYNAYMKEHALFYYMFFIFGGFHIAFCVYMLVGIPSTGSGGLINCIAAFASGSIVTGVFCAIATVGWGLQTLGMLFEYRSIYNHHNAKGHTFQQAKNEMAQHGFKAYFSRGDKV